MKNFIINHKEFFTAMAVFAVVVACNESCLASSIGEAGLSGTVSGIKWPWTKFLNSLAEELTGPVPKVLGIMGIAGAAIAMFAGHGGPGTNKFITLIFAVSICLFAPTFINAIVNSGSGMTILGF